MFFRTRSVRAVRARRNDLAFGTGQLRSTPPGLLRLRRAFAPRKALALAFRAPAPHGASQDGPLAPHRLEQPSPWMSPIPDASCRNRGHRLVGSIPDGKLAGFITRQPGRPRPTVLLPDGMSTRWSRRLRSCRDRSRWLSSAERSHALELSACAAARTVLTAEATLGVRQHDCGSLQGLHHALLAWRHAPRWCAMRRTDFCLFTHFV